MTEDISATPSPRASSPKVPAAKFGGRGINIGIAVAAVVTVAGLALWVVQLSGGLVQTGMRNFDSWGLYITLFMFLVGLSAGGLIISSVPRAFGMKGFGGISKVAVWTSICCTVLAIAFVVVDLGHPARLWELFAYSNLGSPLMWDIVVLGTYLVLSIAYLWATLRFEGGKGSERSLRAISVVALACAILVHSVTAWIFGLQQSHEMWYTALLAPWFVSSALVCGTSLVLVVVIVLRRAGYLELDQASIVKLAKMLGAFVLVDLYFFACDLLTAGFPNASGAEVRRAARTVLLDRGRGLHPLRRGVLRAEAAHEPAHRGGIAAGHRGHLLQARAAAGRWLPDPEHRHGRSPDALHRHRLGVRHGGGLPGDGLLPDAARVRRGAGRGGPGGAPFAGRVEVPTSQAGRVTATTVRSKRAGSERPPSLPGAPSWFDGAPIAACALSCGRRPPT